jgi:tRNA (guanine37-N1)-methyltransferase
MNIGIITLFPEMFEALHFGITGRAIENNLINLYYFNPRDFATDKHRTVDDRPYGGGPGMLMKVQPVQDAILKAKTAMNSAAKVVYVSPQGRLFDQKTAEEMSNRQSIIFLAGRYEGIDERLIQTEIDEEWSIGDYILSGGELALMVIIDALTRLLPNALGDELSAEQDSFSNGLLDYPHFTRPETIHHLNVPKVLLSGNHQAIMRWRLKQSLGRTLLKRPDLLNVRKLGILEQELLSEFINEHKHEA